MPSERQLSSELGVSRVVVRSALTVLAGRGIIEAKPRCRPVVKGLADTPVRRRNVGKRHIAIWLWPNPGDYAAASILRGIQAAATGPDVRLVVASAVGLAWPAVLESEAAFFRSVLNDHEEAGIVTYYLGAETNLPVVQELRAAQVPIVFVDRMPPAGFPGDFVGTDNEGCSRRAVRHLLDLGHRSVALISNTEPVSSVIGREAGYRRAIREGGLELREELIYRDAIDDPVGVEMALDHLLAQENPPTAIFCINDMLALQVMEALAARKLSVPGHMSVVGFDGMLRWLPGGGPLTTCAQDFERIGQVAAELIIERLDAPNQDTYRHVLLDAPIFAGGATCAEIAPQPAFNGAH